MNIDVASRALRDSNGAGDAVGRQRSLAGPIAWRNLWRNRRRTLLSAGAIAFSVALLSFAMSMQGGSYATMIDNATHLLHGHLQLQRVGYVDDPRIEDAIDNAAARLAAVRTVSGVATATPRIAAFALVSGNDRSYGAQLLGVDPAGERALSRLPTMLAEGRYIESGAEAYAGRMLARNLGVSVGDQIVVLGTATDGGVAALAVTLVGTFDSGVAELDRQLLEIPLPVVAEAFAMHDAVHAIVVRAESVALAPAVARALRKDLPEGEAVLEWQTLIPELAQAITLDRAFGEILFGILAAVVTIGVLNSFLMTVFERTREFGMLMAIGMRSRSIMALLQTEALLLSSLGCAIGVAVGVPLVLWVSRIGIPVGDASAAMQVFHLADRLYPALNASAIVRPVVLLMVCTQLAALLPALRVRRLQPVEALRAE